jgi:hypothetical protein
MPPQSPDPQTWTDRVRAALARYSEPLFRSSTGSLVKPRIGQSIEELLDRVCDAQTNAPVIDRRLRELPAGSQALVRLVGLTRLPVWKAGHLIALTAAAGHLDGFAPVEELLRAGIAFPADTDGSTIADFPSWLGRTGMLAAPVFVHPAVLARARGLVAAPAAKPRGAAVTTDGLEWPLRLAAAWQRSRAAAVKTTMSKTLFKRDLARFQSDDLLGSPFADLAVTVPDAGVLAFEWAAAAGLFRPGNNEFVAEPAIPGWSDSVWQTLATLFSRFFAVETWDPRKGYAPAEGGLNPTPTAALMILDQLARTPGTALTAAELAEPLWEFHPSWPSALSREDARTHGVDWIEAFLASVAFPLRVVELPPGEPRSFRLSEFGRHLLCGEPEPPAPPSFPQTLTVQPNAEMIVYRQGLTPLLIAELSRFAAWKQFGPACTLELTADETYRGLESGLTLAVMKQTLDRHAMRPLPANVADLLRRWADKRERVTVYPSATLVEFLHPAELDLALSRGLVAIKLTDRIGLTADGRDPDFKALRLIGNREYDARPVKCVSVAADGLTLTVDAGQADLLLEAEIGRIAEAIPMNGSAHRQFRMTPASLRAANGRGMNLESLDRWLTTRAGEPLSPAGRLFITVAPSPAPRATTCRVVRLPTSEFADGLQQWPETAGLVRERLGPTAVVVNAEDVPALRALLESLGIGLEEYD